MPHPVVCFPPVGINYPSVKKRLNKCCYTLNGTVFYLLLCTKQISLVNKNPWVRIWLFAFVEFNCKKFKNIVSSIN